MPDTAIITLGEYQAVDLDWLLSPGDDLENDGELVNAVAIALGTDRLAKRDDALPDPNNTDRRGWWADMDALEIWGAGPIGSRYWLLERETITGSEARKGSTVAKVEAYTREAVQPFKDARIASAIQLQATRIGVERIDCDVTLFRGPQAAVELRFSGLWSGIKA